MYTVSRDPTRIINRTRRDITRKLENLEINRELRRKNSGGSDDSDQIIMSCPRPTFQLSTSSKQLRHSNNRHNHHHNHHDLPTHSPSHLEIVSLFTETWARIQEELDSYGGDACKQNGHTSRGSLSLRVYEETEIHPAMKDFKPFELEAWWGKRLYDKMTED